MFRVVTACRCCKRFPFRFHMVDSDDAPKTTRRKNAVIGESWIRLVVNCILTNPAGYLLALLAVNARKAATEQGACFTTKYSGIIFHDACAVCVFDLRRSCHCRWHHTVWRQRQNILPESGMTEFGDVGYFVSQSGAASFRSGDVSKLSGAQTKGICNNEHRKQLTKRYFTE